ncbi:MAG: hypothetical protein AAFN59_11370, partial [Pseudomonadota bacterium]
MLTSPAPIALGRSDPVQLGPKSIEARLDATGVGAPETAARAAPIAAPDQPGNTARLRDGETAETTDRDLPAEDSPTGPPPAFRETPLERAGRVMLSPENPSDAEMPKETQSLPDDAKAPPSEPTTVPPTPTQQAQTEFARAQVIDAGRATTRLEITI